MRQEAGERRTKVILDILIIICGAGLACCILKEIRTWRISPVFLFVVVIGMAWVLYDIFFLRHRGKTEVSVSGPEVFHNQGIQRVILLDEEGKPVISPGSKVQFPMIATGDGKRFFMAFTDEGEYNKWVEKSSERLPVFALTLDDY
ncbi:MAG: SseB family protein, partial [Acetatifactor sp.]|nr:SseB family protein [Acetatifactor sp.]